MKKKISYALGSVCLLLILFIACKKNPVREPEPTAKGLPTESIPEASDDLQKRMEQRAIVGATVMQDPEILRLLATAIRDKITENPQNDEAITFDEIARERPAYVASFARAFKTKFKSVLLSNRYFRAPNFKVVAPGQPSGRIKPDDMPGYDPVFYLNDAAQIYFPYSENFDPKSLTSAAITYHPLKEVEENEAFVWGNSEISVFTVDERYAEENPVFVINFNEVVEGTDGIMTPPPPTIDCQMLTWNTWSDVIDDQYVISVTMPKIKLTDQFRSWIGGSNYLTVAQFYAKPGNLNPNPSPALNPITADMRYVVKDFRIKRKDVKKHKWVDFGQIWNDDWRLIQYDNPIYAWAKRGWFYGAGGSVDVTIQGGLKLDTIHIGGPPFPPDSIRYQWTPSFNVGASVKFHLDMDAKYDLLGTDYITRRGALANIVGDNFGNGDAIQAGESTPWSVRKVGKMLYYFKIKECHRP